MANNKFIEQGKAAIANLLDEPLPEKQEEPEGELNAEAGKEADVIPDPESISQVVPQSDEITLMELKANVKAKVKKKHLEDDHKKASYWLTPGEIKMVNEMAKAAGKDKYEIVGFAIRYLYRKIFED